jgi:hypothetical protein
MPPKNAEKQRKLVEDKTFGMKNRKGGKGQKAVQLAQQQASTAGRNKESVAKEKEKALLAKKKEQVRASLARHRRCADSLHRKRRRRRSSPNARRPRFHASAVPHTAHSLQTRTSPAEGAIWC